MNLFSDRETRTLDRLLHVQHPGRRDHEPRAHEGALQQRTLDRKARQAAEPFVTTLGLLSCKAKDAFCSLEKGALVQLIFSAI